MLIKRCNAVLEKEAGDFDPDTFHIRTPDAGLALMIDVAGDESSLSHST